MHTKMKNIYENRSRPDEAWQTVVIGEVNASPVFMREMRETEAQFHSHAGSDEMFIVLEGEVYMETRESSIHLARGDTFTVKAGTEHRTRAPSYARLLVIGGKDA